MFKMNFERGAYRSLREQLLPHQLRTEQAAFAFFAFEESASGGQLFVRNIQLLGQSNFVSQKSDYLEVSDQTRRDVIKKAHAEGLAVAEFHSHPFDMPAEFSYADFDGLTHTVPHMLWRLKERPYVAVVVGPRDFDGLIWLPDKSVSVLATIFDGDDEFAATGRSINQWQ